MAREPREIPTSSGIYQIRCRVNSKIYIGSAVNLRARWDGHRRELRKGLHYNAHLQRAWIRYREGNFEFVVLEFVEATRLLEAEQHWIDRTGCTDQRLGYNIKLDATSGGCGLGRTWLGFRDPHGHPVIIANLSDFCRRNRLDFPSMHRLAKGQSKLKSYKGWTHANSVRQREFIKTHTGFHQPRWKTRRSYSESGRILPRPWSRQHAHDCSCERPHRFASRVDSCER